MAADDDFEPILCWSSWWDCPRSGVTLHARRPHRFLCEFSDELDDYPQEFHVWPIDDDTAEAEFRAWRMFAAWRARFDRGVKPPPLESDSEFADLAGSLREGRLTPPTDSIVAVPTWRLDRDRTFREREPSHEVRWIEQ
jgi:hypothetical protein